MLAHCCKVCPEFCVNGQRFVFGDGGRGRGQWSVSLHKRVHPIDQSREPFPQQAESRDGHLQATASPCLLSCAESASLW